MRFNYFLILIIFVFNLYSQKIDANQKISAEFLYPMPQSEETFKEIYKGVLGANFSYRNFITPEFFIGPSLSYYRFNTADFFINWEITNVLVTPSVEFGYKLQMDYDYNLVPIIRIGYTWSEIQNTDIGYQFHESGFSIEPALNLGLFVFGNFDLYVASSYKIIFENYGDDSIEEGGTIRHFNLGIGASYNW